MIKKCWFVKLSEGIANFHLQFAQQVGPVLLTVCAVWIGIWFPEQHEKFKELEGSNIFFWLIKQKTFWFFVVSVVVSLYGGFVGAIDARKKERDIKNLRESLREYQKLPAELEEAQESIDYARIQQANFVYSITSEYLAHLANDHLFFNDSERISLYLHESDRFILAGRYSKNVEYNKRNRSAYPDNQGCIGKVWHEGGECFVCLPTDEAELYSVLKSEYGIDKGIAKSLRMKSKLYCGIALDHGSTRVGIIMFESLNEDGLIEQDIKSISSDHSSYLIEMIKRTKEVNALVTHQSIGG